MVVSAVGFSALHFPTLDLFWQRVVTGMIYAGLYFWSRSLWVPFAAHAAGNLLFTMTMFGTGPG